MALYPYEVLSSIPNDVVLIPPGSAIAVPFTLIAQQRLQLDVVQATDLSKQDFSIRAWISKTPLGSPDPTLPQYVQTWAPSKAIGCVVISFYDTGLTPDTRYPVAATAGDYFINVLDLSNQPNQFSLTIMDTTARDPG